MNRIMQDFCDNDFYTFSQGQMVFNQFPNAWVKWRYTNRAENKSYRPGFADELKEQIGMMSEVGLTKQMFDFFRTKTPWLKPTYLEWLRQYRYNPKDVSVKQESDGSLNLEIEGPWYKTIYWEVPLLYTITQLFRTVPDSGGQTLEKKPGWKDAIAEKGRRLYSAGVNWIDFGTRRRYDTETQDAVIQEFLQYRPGKITGHGFRGTSNPYYAMKYGVPVNGTFAHQTPMAMQALYSLTECNLKAMDHWIKEYRGQLGICLMDTITTGKFLEVFDSFYANLFQGVRQDSGDPIEIGEMVIAHYEKLGIDPTTKILVFSDGLDVDKTLKIYHHFVGRIRMTFGIGTNLTNDVGYPPSNHVIKMIGADFGRGMYELLKIPDEKGKRTGGSQSINDALRLLRIS